MKRRGLGLGVTGTLAVVCAGAAWKLWRNQLGGLSLKEEIAAARREGVPLDPQDLAAPGTPSKENAAEPYLRATAHAIALKRGESWPLPFDRLLPSFRRPTVATSLSTADKKRIRAFIAPYLPALIPLREASARSRLALNRQWDSDDAYQDIHGLKRLVQILVARANLRSAEGDIQGAFTDLEDAARASALLAWGKSWDEGAVRTTLETTILWAVKEVVNRDPKDVRSSPRIRRIVTSLGPPTHLRRMLATQPYESLRHTIFLPPGNELYAAASLPLRLKSVREANGAYTISYWRYVFSRLPDDPLAFDAARNAVRDAFDRYDEANTLRTQGPLIQSLEGTVLQLAAQEARRRIALTTADVLENWQRDGKLPAKPPQARKDPFGGDLRYRCEDQGFTVYSVDKNGKDDGGRASRSGERESDIVWRMTLPATIAVAKR